MNEAEGLKTAINPQLSDRLYTLAAEYSVSTDLLVHLSVQRLLDDVDLFRRLRAGAYKPE